MAVDRAVFNVVSEAVHGDVFVSVAVSWAVFEAVNRAVWGAGDQNFDGGFDDAQH